MRRLLMTCLAAFLLSSAALWSQDSDLKDTPYFSGMPNYRITDGEDKEFASYLFYNGKDCKPVEGRKSHRAYTLKENASRASELQIMRNYTNAIKSLGGTVLFQGVCPDARAENSGYNMVVGLMRKEDSELWVEVCPFNDGGDYYITLVVKEAMKQDVSANDMLDALNRQGYVALYINFDTGKATIKPDSRPVIDQIVQMLETNPSLKISVEGHTDNVGAPISNQILSEHRAKAVLAAIVSQGIDQARLSAVGHGQIKPIADNKTEEGRAKNRRVELVKK